MQKKWKILHVWLTEFCNYCVVICSLRNESLTSIESFENFSWKFMVRRTLKTNNICSSNVIIHWQRNACRQHYLYHWTSGYYCCRGTICIFTWYIVIRLKYNARLDILTTSWKHVEGVEPLTPNLPITMKLMPPSIPQFTQKQRYDDNLGPTNINQRSKISAVTCVGKDNCIATYIGVH